MQPKNKKIAFDTSKRIIKWLGWCMLTAGLIIFNIILKIIV